MKRTMFIGETGVGKRTLIQAVAALSGEYFTLHKPMSVEFHGQFINTPGEFLENRRFYLALITASTSCEVLVMVQDATSISSLFPPQFATTFNRKIVGVISKIDSPEANNARAERFLRNAGVKNILLVSAKNSVGLDALHAMLQ